MKNGYAPSLFNTEDGFCYVHKDYCGTERHEIFPKHNRDNSKRYGLWIAVCPMCHRLGEKNCHNESEGEFRYLREEAQQLFEEEYPDKDFLAIFGKNYL